MAKPKIPNNPMQAFLLGRRTGAQETMSNVAHVLTDKFGWHIKEETEESRDTKSIQYLYDCLVDLKEKIDSGRITYKDIKEVLATEHNAEFAD